jgi:hypothetical protein
MFTTITESGTRSHDSGSRFGLFAKFNWVASAKAYSGKGIYAYISQSEKQNPCRLI